MVRRLWPIQKAKIRFAELVEAARRKPQVVTKHRKPVVIVVAANEYERLCKLQRLKTPSFAEMLLAMPQGGRAFERLNAALGARGAPLHKRIADIARDATRLGAKRGRAVKKREIDHLWGNA